MVLGNIWTSLSLKVCPGSGLLFRKEGSTFLQAFMWYNILNCARMQVRRVKCILKCIGALHCNFQKEQIYSSKGFNFETKNYAFLFNQC